MSPTGERSVRVRWGATGPTASLPAGTPWLEAAARLGQTIPTGCLHGSCGACEIEVDGQVVRACIATVPPSDAEQPLQVELGSDPYWCC